ncbi:MAG: RNA polymerase sigma factor [Bacteroidota bacterium]|nr:RNA polymerase sigma factor [Bacteroidota bacterium]
MARPEPPFGAHGGMVNEGLIERCVREDRKAQYELYRALYPLMMSICSRYERNKQDALARVNLGFLKILQNIGKRRPDVPFEPWVRKIMINTVIDEFRKDRQRKEIETIGEVMEQKGANSANEYLKNMEAEAFELLLKELPAMSRNVFNLFAIDGFAHAEIAELFGISIGTSKWHVSHARSVLQQKLMDRTSLKVPVR